MRKALDVEIASLNLIMLLLFEYLHQWIFFLVSLNFFSYKIYTTQCLNYSAIWNFNYIGLFAFCFSIFSQ